MAVLSDIGFSPGGDGRSILQTLLDLLLQVHVASDELDVSLQGLENFLHQQVHNHNSSSRPFSRHPDGAESDGPFAAADAALLDTSERLRLALKARDRQAESIELVEVHIRTALDNPRLADCPSGSCGAGGLTPPVARRLEIVRYPNGWAEIHIDAEVPFLLPPDLTDYLELLAWDDGSSTDMLVPWKSREKVRQWLRSQRKKDMRPQLVNKRVHDLQEALREAGIKRKLIHTHPLKGIRFALMRGQGRLVVRWADKPGDAR